MLLERFVLGRARSNAYVYAPGGAAGRKALIIDPGVGAAPRIAQLIHGEGLEPAAVLLTHGHPDHVWTLRHVAERFDVPSYFHPLDLEWLRDPATGGHVPVIRWGGRLVGRMRKLEPHRLSHVEHGHTIEAAGLRVDVLHTPGHTRGSVCFRVDRLCFVGDTIFRSALGHTAYPGGSKRALRESIRSKLLPLADAVRLLPGHGSETSVGDERTMWERETS